MPLRAVLSWQRSHHDPPSVAGRAMTSIAGRACDAAPAGLGSARRWSPSEGTRRDIETSRIEALRRTEGEAERGGCDRRHQSGCRPDSGGLSVRRHAGDGEVWNLSSLACQLFFLDMCVRHTSFLLDVLCSTASARLACKRKPAAVGLVVSSQRVAEPCSAKSKHSHTH